VKRPAPRKQKLSPFQPTSNYKFCGYDILPDFSVFDIFKKTADIPHALEAYRKQLEIHCS
jgi:modulator of drug activity B